jgi:hypothetical protein
MVESKQVGQYVPTTEAVRRILAAHVVPEGVTVQDIVELLDRARPATTVERTLNRLVTDGRAVRVPGSDPARYTPGPNTDRPTRLGKSGCLKHVSNATRQLHAVGTNPRGYTVCEVHRQLLSGGETRYSEVSVSRSLSKMLAMGLVTATPDPAAGRGAKRYLLTGNVSTAPVVPNETAQQAHDDGRYPTRRNERTAVFRAEVQQALRTCLRRPGAHPDGATSTQVKAVLHAAGAHVHLLSGVHAYLYDLFMNGVLRRADIHDERRSSKDPIYRYTFVWLSDLEGAAFPDVPEAPAQPQPCQPPVQLPLQHVPQPPPKVPVVAPAAVPVAPPAASTYGPERNKEQLASIARAFNLVVGDAYRHGELTPTTMRTALDLHERLLIFIEELQSIPHKGQSNCSGT